MPGTNVYPNNVDCKWLVTVRTRQAISVRIHMLSIEVSAGCSDERIGFGLYQSCGDKGSVGHVSVFWLRWCGWCRWGMDRGLGQGSGAVGWCYVCVRCESGFSV